MAERDPSFAKGTQRLLVGAAVISIVLLVAIVVWPLLTSNQVGTPPGGANPEQASDTTASRGTPAQKAAESTVGKNNPAGQEDQSGGRARAIKESSRPLQLDDAKRKQIKDIIARQSAPKMQQANFEVMIGASVPQGVDLRDLPPEITEVMNGYWGDQYVLVQDKMIIVDQHSRRIVAIVPSA
jgi:hypothetical protein